MGAALIPLGAGLLQGIGSAISGNAQADANKQAQKQAQVQSNGQQAVQLQHELDTDPLRDRILYMLQQRFAQTPQRFQPHDIFNQSTSQATPQYGGYDMAALQRANQAYRPGMGGVNSAVADHQINKLGFGETTTNPLGQQTGQPTVYGGDFARWKAAQPATLESRHEQLEAARKKVQHIMGY